MEDSFPLHVSYNGNEYAFPACILNYGYVVKLEVEIEGTVVTFEPDEERNWRAVVGFEDLIANKKVKKELLEAVASVISEATR